MSFPVFFENDSIDNLQKRKHWGVPNFKVFNRKTDLPFSRKNRISISFQINERKGVIPSRMHWMEIDRGHSKRFDSCQGLGFVLAENRCF